MRFAARLEVVPFPVVLVSRVVVRVETTPPVGFTARLEAAPFQSENHSERKQPEQPADRSAEALY